MTRQRTGKEERTSRWGYSKRTWLRLRNPLKSTKNGSPFPTFETPLHGVTQTAESRDVKGKIRQKSGRPVFRTFDVNSLDERWIEGQSTMVTLRDRPQTFHFHSFFIKKDICVNTKNVCYVIVYSVLRVVVVVTIGTCLHRRPKDG